MSAVPEIDRALVQPQPMPAPANGAHVSEPWEAGPPPEHDECAPPDVSDHALGYAAPLAMITLREFVAQTIAIEFVADDVLRRGFLYSLTGSTGSGKTGVAVPLALSVAVAAVFGAHNTIGGNVVYVASENPEDVRARFVVALERMALPPRVLDSVHVIDKSFVLAQRIGELCELVESVGAVLVIVDTDQAVSLGAGSDENDNGERIGHAKRLRTITRSSPRPCVLDLCHPRKNVTGREDLIPRGGGAFLNEVDGNFRLWRDGDVAELTSDANKFRGAPVAITFKSELVTTGAIKDTKGRLIAIPYFSPISDMEAARVAHQTWTDENRLVAAMAANPGGTQAEWAVSCGWLDAKGLGRRDKVNVLLGKLEGANPPLVARSRRGGDWKLTKAGRTEADKP